MQNIRVTACCMDRFPGELESGVCLPRGIDGCRHTRSHLPFRSFLISTGLGWDLLRLMWESNAISSNFRGEVSTFQFGLYWKQGLVLGLGTWIWVGRWICVGRFRYYSSWFKDGSGACYVYSCRPSFFIERFAKPVFLDD
ncbi:hypothetical protein CC80DRAFT_191989 [Byssothecium circinans]|uniref:Uncharacterized protein n=1 Tax=Byssothecium circinans TaxID=147558 RepID=A0A6A5TLK3_9PLEO|nr:hypothetical protein CC80DRAFT_191989 [Byssothecium circinans]